MCTVDLKYPLYTHDQGNLVSLYICMSIHMHVDRHLVHKITLHTGQFWNTPVEIKAISGKRAITGREYQVFVPSSDRHLRNFTGNYYPITWDYGKTPCLYAGTRDGSPVIEGKFTEYEVKKLFDPHFSYSQFKESQKCSV